MECNKFPRNLILFPIQTCMTLRHFVKSMYSDTFRTNWDTTPAGPDPSESSKSGGERVGGGGSSPGWLAVGPIKTSFEFWFPSLSPFLPPNGVIGCQKSGATLQAQLLVI
jgi:hypothetical protein